MPTEKNGSNGQRSVGGRSIGEDGGTAQDKVGQKVLVPLAFDRNDAVRFDDRFRHRHLFLRSGTAFFVKNDKDSAPSYCGTVCPVTDRYFKKQGADRSETDAKNVKIWMGTKRTITLSGAICYQRDRPRKKGANEFGPPDGIGAKANRRWEA